MTWRVLASASYRHRATDTASAENCQFIAPTPHRHSDAARDERRHIRLRHNRRHHINGAHLQKVLLSRHHTFEPLHRPADDVPLSSAAASNLFSSHAQHLLPNDTNCAAQRELAPGSLSPVHCFSFIAAIAEPLNKRLTALAMDLERRRDETGVHKSNVGGYQSTADLFFMLGCDDAERLSTCRELHALVSAAVDELRGATGDGEAREEAPTAAEEDDGDDADGLPNLLDDESAEPFGAWPWRLGKPPTSSPLLLHPACAWLNVNRKSDSNTVHIHHPQRWSAVYFVASGPGASSPPPPPAGHLILRGGRQSKGSASHTYLAVPPTPGTVWFFGGSIPHCVFPLEPQQDEEEDVEIASYTRVWSGATHLCRDQPRGGGAEEANTRMGVAVGGGDGGRSRVVAASQRVG